MSEWNEAALSNAIDQLPPEVRDVLARHHFDRERWLAQGRPLHAGEEAKLPIDDIEPPRPEDLVTPPEPGTPRHAELTALGEAALRAGQCALVVLAGGMATRMGSVVKALVDALDGQSFLDLRLAEQAHLGKKYGAVPPLWLMTSPSTEQGIDGALAGKKKADELATFPQSVSLRWTPRGEIVRDDEGHVSIYGTGHGDLPEALQKSGLLDRFVERGGRYVQVCNIDNVGAGLDPLLIGLHIDGKSAISCEVVEKKDNDRGGIPVRRGDRTIIREEFLLPPGFDPKKVRVFNSNTLAFDAAALLALRTPFSYFRVKKTVQGQDVVQFERLIHEATLSLSTRYVLVPREGSRSRFLPVKDPDELKARQAELAEVARARGML